MLNVIVMGKKIGTCSAFEAITDTDSLIIQYTKFEPELEYGFMPTSDYLSIDFIDGEYKAYHEDGEVNQTGKVFK